MAKITIIGSGALGTAIGKILFNLKHEVLIYGIDNKELLELKQGKNTKYFSEDVFLPNFQTSNDLKTALQDIDYLFLALPSVAMGMVLKKILDMLNHKVRIINGSKGFYPGTTISLHEKIVELTDNNEYIDSVVSLVGPSHAEEIVNENYAALCAVSFDEEESQKVQELFEGSSFRIYIQTDVVGAEISTSYKNVVAIVSGMAKENGFGINTQAAIITRALQELFKIIDFHGGDPKTATGLTGVGDLIVTATSDLSRNYTFGREFIRDGFKALETKRTVEGLAALKGFYQLNNETMHLDLPIINFAYNVIYDKKDMKNEIKKLLRRKNKNEFQ